MLYNIIAILISLIIPSFLLIKTNKFKISLYAILVLGCMLRLININVLPNGLNVDEASSAYDAFSLAHNGFDRNGITWPLYMIAWGSGQSALYTYLLIPFIALFDLSIITTRLPMALVSCFSLVTMYFLLKNIFKDKKAIIIGMVFFVICPWHIMKSRWGLDANLFPDIFLLAVLFLILGLKNKKNLFIYLGFGIMGISAYTYATSYFFLPIFVAILVIYLIWKKILNIKTVLISGGIIFAVTLPLILFVIINTFDLPQIKVLGMTIPRLVVNRYEEISNLFSGGFIQSSITNFLNACIMLLVQYDGLPWNQLKGIGLVYLISLPFLIFGLINSFSKYKNNIGNILMNIWFIASVLLLFICEANINRINIIVIPIIYYTIVGLYEFSKKFPKMMLIICIAYIIYFGIFMFVYSKTDYTKYYLFQENIQEVVEYAQKSEANNIYVDYSFKEPYIYFLFYSKYDTKEYIDTVEVFNENGSFDNVKGFGRYKFYVPEVVEEGLIILPKNKVYNGKAEIIEFDRFNVYKV